MAKDLSSIVKALPDKPGVYQYFDGTDTIIYVGKAKSLKKRVASYFNKQDHSAKTRILVGKIKDIRYTVVESEYDALILENAMIKEHQPRYNILLKDDKTFPWICIKKERFPRVFSTRKLERDGSDYFGPYTSVRTMNTVLDLIKRLYPIRTCSYVLSEENIEAGKFRLCLEYQVGNCKGACEGLETEEQYNATIEQIKHILKGNTREVRDYFKVAMKEAAANLEFERAQQLKDKLEHVEKYQGRSMVASPKIKDADVFALHMEDKIAFIHYMKIMNGTIVQSLTVEAKRKLEEIESELLEQAVTHLRDTFNSEAKEVLSSHPVEIEIPGVKWSVPIRGEKKDLVDLAKKNLKFYLLDKKRTQQLTDPNRRTNEILEELKNAIGMQALPVHIECFDNSNFQGTNAVAACVVFKQAKPSKRDYRHFNIKTVEGPDDFASMQEVVFRRYKRLLDEDQPLPQLVVIDGGKGQLSHAVDALNELGIKNQIAVIGIAKKLEEIYRPGDPVPLYLDKTSPALKLIQNLRNEAHRFGITHHRNKRSKEQNRTVLTEIEGIGESTAQALLAQFKSVERVKAAKDEELSQLLNLRQLKGLRAFFED